MQGGGRLTWGRGGGEVMEGGDVRLGDVQALHNADNRGGSQKATETRSGGCPAVVRQNGVTCKARRIRQIYNGDGSDCRVGIVTRA